MTKGQWPQDHRPLNTGAGIKPEMNSKQSMTPGKGWKTPATLAAA